MDIIVNHSSMQPIYEQIYEQIKNLIITEELEAGQMLPSIRGLAKDLRISVITTKRAYDELEKDDLLILWQEKAVLWRRRIWSLSRRRI